jgi:imidazolonepropionase-like amidohydrolase
MLAKALAITLLAVGFSSEVRANAPEAQHLALVGGTIIKRYGEPAIEDGVVVIQRDRITCVGSRGQCPLPQGSRIVDAKSRFVAPGLIDAHVHYAQTGWFDGSPAGFEVSRIYPKAEVDQRAADSRHDTDRTYLCSGITSVLDMGGPDWTLKHKSESSVLKAVAGPLLSNAPLLASFNSEKAISIVAVRDPDAMRREVRRLIATNVDVVKLLLMPPASDGQATYDALIAAAVETAKETRTPVALHALNLRDAAASVRLGVDILVHSVMDEPMGDELAARMAEAGVVYIPTFVVRRRLAEGYAVILERAEYSASDPLGCLDGRTARLAARDADKLAAAAPDTMKTDSFSADQIAVATRQEGVMAHNLRTALKAGVTVAMGSDAGNPNTPHGLGLLHEVNALEEAGFAPEVLLRSATLGGAKALRLEGRIGLIAEGAQADLVIYDKDPRSGTGHLTAIRQVIAQGRLR